MKPVKPSPARRLRCTQLSLSVAKPVAQATTDSHGHYLISDAMVPVQTSFNGHPFRKEMTPYAGFILNGLAPGLGSGSRGSVSRIRLRASARMQPTNMATRRFPPKARPWS